MTEAQALALTSTLGTIVLVGGSLIVRRFPSRTLWRLALIWTGIFAVLFLTLRMFPNIVANFT